MRERWRRLSVAVMAWPWSELGWDAALLLGIALVSVGVVELAGWPWLAILQGVALLAACGERERRRLRLARKGGE